MQKILLALAMVFLLAGSAAAHGGIPKLPDSVQILQYQMKLYTNPDDADVKNQLAMAYMRTNQLDEAKKQLDPVLAKDANNFDALDGMGIILIKQGKADKGLEFLQRAQKINDKDLMLHVHLAVAHTKLGQADLAESEIAKAKSLAATPEEEAKIQEEINMISNS